MMDPKSPRLLEDIAAACAFVAASTASVTAADYVANQLLRQAMERNLEIIGEALVRLERIDLRTASRITDYRAVVGLRNRLIHGYDRISHVRVWQIIQSALPVLHRQVEELIREAEGETGDEP